MASGLKSALELKTCCVALYKSSAHLGQLVRGSGGKNERPLIHTILQNTLGSLPHVDLMQGGGRFAGAPHLIHASYFSRVANRRECGRAHQKVPILEHRQFFVESQAERFDQAARHRKGADWGFIFPDVAQPVEVELVAELKRGLDQVRMRVRLLWRRYFAYGHAGTDDGSTACSLDERLDPVRHDQVVIIEKRHILRFDPGKRRIERTSTPSAGNVYDSDPGREHRIEIGHYVLHFTKHRLGVVGVNHEKHFKAVRRLRRQARERVAQT